MPNPIASSAIRAELARRGLKQVDVAEKLGIDPAQVGRRMNGDIDWRLSELQAVAAMLEVPVSALVDEPPVAATGSAVA
jgi:transcriptional regulator with XRE-family HTH domain